MKKSKKRVIENIQILDFAAEGKCIVKDDGEVIFVEGSNVCPGDEVKLLVSKTKKNFSEGRILAINKLSTDRIQPFCEHFGVCGGCKWQHIPYEKQIEQKQKQVYDQLTRIGKVKLPQFTPILGSSNTQFYRNKLEYTFSNSRWLTNDEVASGEEISKDALGFHIPKRFEKVLPIKKCYLQGDPSNAIRDFFTDYAHKSGLPFYDHVVHKGFFRNVMIRTTSTGEVMVVLQIADDSVEKIEKVLNEFIVKFPKTTSLNYFINKKRNDSYFDLEPVNFYGLPYITEQMEGLSFRIGVKSFYQTNSDQAYNLYKIVRDFAQISENDLVYDLYTGTGTIANFVAKKAKKVIGIEYIDAAVEDAIVNSKINAIDNTRFFAGDMAKIFTDDFIAQNGKPDIVIVDPPRAGMDRPVCELLLRISPKRIVYVSCNPATQARDIEILSAKYEVEKINPVDMFPHTFHVENVASLVLKS
ncbi:MAG: 23S rRNA (uracil(1939)-C(5))-methyltransferase RlmD [Cytophagaceae bacterium BCCC1]|nr:MAG: 23S rRNA (uracil(1939)-C(5))-methyltransferase RlmD [Cytophagaceae bacterium BCCC1]